MKPRARRERNGSWSCSNGHCAGYGLTLPEAYALLQGAIAMASQCPPLPRRSAIILPFRKHPHESQGVRQ